MLFVFIAANDSMCSKQVTLLELLAISMGIVQPKCLMIWPIVYRGFA